jgi:hypothetical protein
MECSLATHDGHFEYISRLPRGIGKSWISLGKKPAAVEGSGLQGFSDKTNLINARNFV